jgi:phytoene synthase
MNTSLEEYYLQFESFEAVQKKYGTSYYIATLFFPKKIREATFALYTWVRIPDEIVDTAEGRGEKESRELLFAWRNAWESAYKNKSSEIKNHDAVQRIFHTYNIPYEYSTAFLDAMEQDLTKTTYSNYAELKAYMYGSAAVVGLMMSHIIGFKEGALSHAIELGEAMQLTNFLRDIDEDYVDRERVYMPLNDLAKYEITADDIKYKKEEKLQLFLKEYISKTDNLYDASLAGISKLRTGKFAVLFAHNLYREILRKIEKNKYNVFNGKLRTNEYDKFIILIRTLWQLLIKKY